MRTKLIAILVACVVVLAATGAGLGKALYNSKQENNRLSGNISALITSSGEAEKEKQALILTTKEMKQVIESDSMLISHLYDSLNIQAKRIESLVTIQAKTRYSIKTELTDTTIVIAQIEQTVEQDSIILSDSTITVQKFNWSNQYLTTSGIVYPDSIQIDYSHLNRGTLVIHQKKFRKFFIARWFEKPTLTAEIIDEDPNSEFLIDKVLFKRR